MLSLLPLAGAASHQRRATPIRAERDVTPRQAEIRALVAKAQLINPKLNADIANRFIDSGASTIATGSALFSLVCGGASSKSDRLDRSDAFYSKRSPFSEVAVADGVAGTTEFNSLTQ